jgi:NADH:ubiquinone oxidoreductase subunit 6 (subunit J)
VLFAELFVLARNAPEPPESDMLARLLAERGAIGAVAEPLFENYVVAVEVTGVLLLVAMVGAVVIAKRKV